MLQSVRKRVVALPQLPVKRLPVQVVLSAGTLGSFGWMLFQNKIHPIIVYALQVYLTF